MLVLAIVLVGTLLCSGFTAQVYHYPPGYGNGSFAGSASCKSCHTAIYESNIKTAHYLTSRPAASQFIKGSFTSPKNTFAFNKFMQVVMDKTDSGFYQRAFVSGTEYESAPFDIVIGSGRKGQTYLYWQGNQLMQLPISYYTPLNSWCNSPGFSGGNINFSRTIPARCLECHGMYAHAEEDSGITLFDKQSIMYGVDCERCHGPAAEHVQYQQAHPEDKTAKYIVSIKQLSRQQKLDECALCHSGYRKQVTPAFTFNIGDELSKYSLPAYNTDSLQGLDVHGNQYGLLTNSKCFLQSDMNCSSCHDVHKNQVNSPQLFSAKCMACHNSTSGDTCRLPAPQGMVLGDNCIDCHMPLLASKKIFLQLDDPKKSTPDLVRTHHIAIYPKQSKAFVHAARKKREA